MVDPRIILPAVKISVIRWPVDVAGLGALDHLGVCHMNAGQNNLIDLKANLQVSSGEGGDIINTPDHGVLCTVEGLTDLRQDRCRDPSLLLVPRKVDPDTERLLDHWITVPVVPEALTKTICGNTRIPFAAASARICTQAWWGVVPAAIVISGHTAGPSG